MRSLALAALILAACGGDDSSQLIDAPSADAAYDVTRCLITGNYGALGTKTGTAGNVMGNPTLTITLEPGPPRDTFFLKLAMARTPGTYTLAGVDLDFTSCTLCVNVIADIVSMVGPTKFYFADAGTVTLTSTNPPAGSLQNVTFHEVTSSGATVPNGCVASITSMAFGPL
ncbi:MAG: hypothetical protein JWP01_1043 [Myxococcales bacterium]|nr:hypothetical protein [Myxococcales bacterium]